MDLHITGDEAADSVLSKEPFALLAGMMLDQQFPMERAFAGPATIKERFGSIDPSAIAAADPEKFADLCAQPPGIHRYARSMAGRLQELARHIEEQYDGDAAKLWQEATSGKELMTRLQSLPGFGKQKSQIFTALLAKQCGVQPAGWQEVTGDYGLEGAFRSVADVVDTMSLQKVRAFKKEMRAKKKA